MDKMTRSILTGHEDRAIELLGLIYTNIYGPMSKGDTLILSSLLMIYLDLDMCIL